MPSLNLLCHSKTDAQFMQDGWKAVWSIPYISVASCYSSLKQNFIPYRSSKVSDYIFEIHQLWQSGFSKVYSNCWCNCSFEAEIIKICQSSHKIFSNNIMNFQESMTILDPYTKKSGNFMNAPRIYLYIYIYTCTHTYVMGKFIYIYHHDLVLLTWISLNLSCHPSLSSITSGKSSRLHPVSEQNCCR